MILFWKADRVISLSDLKDFIVPHYPSTELLSQTAGLFVVSVSKVFNSRKKKSNPDKSWS